MQKNDEFMFKEKDGIEYKQYVQELVDNDAISHDEGLYLFGYNEYMD